MGVTLQLEYPQAVSYPAILAIILGLLAFHEFSIFFYRLNLHPLARFPGPRLAAITGLYEFYHDAIRPGQYTFVIRQLHHKYGPIVRISPSAVHIDDPDYFDDLYTGAGNKRYKSDMVGKMFTVPTTFFAAQSPEMHRLKRSPLNSFFSKRSVNAVSPLITSQVESLCSRIETFRGSGTVLSLKFAYAALAMDAVTEYCFGRPYGSIAEEDFGKNWTEAADGRSDIVYMNLYFPWVGRLMHSLPLWIVKKMKANIQQAINLQIYSSQQIQSIMDNPEDKKMISSDRSTIFHELLTGDELPASDRNFTHFQAEAYVVVGAGQLTTAFHLQSTSYHVLANPAILAKLKAELAEAMPDPSVLPPLARLEELEYLSAVISEGHRFPHGVMHRNARISPYEPIYYKDWEIPPGTAVSMTNLIIHENEAIYPDHKKFDPSRWLGPEGKRRKKYLVPFAKGPRACLGQNVAQAELYFTLAAVFRRFDFELFDPVREDFDVVRDYYVLMPRPGGQGLRVLVH
ncbi:putative P450 monooxygenase [Teratosphaeria nubilosa]|uniref:Putative P450 monooxygenase n=1 Tax=Teratosphaeria nubilosa TaxID=161662 RepID=A0A6G1L0Z9_9PEZI|nr:putative P450 monooxygenase [Teratosphaeria nubilosa]